MTSHYTEIAFTGAVKDQQRRHGSRAAYAKRETTESTSGDRMSPTEASFIASRDSFYMATTSETGWPYIQHRGGPAGFVRVLDDRTLGFADFRGNRQYISLGNLAHDKRVSLFFMDYVNRARLKLLGHAREADLSGDADLAERLALPGYRAPVERAIVIDVEAFDWNCQQYIAPRFTEDQVKQAVAPLRQRIVDLEEQIARQA